MTNPAAGYFAQEFNRRLGRFTRNPAQRTPEASLVLSLGARLLNEKQRIEVAEKLERQERADKNWEDKVAGRSVGGNGASSTPEYGNLSRDTANLLTDESNTGFMSKIDLPEWVPGNKGISDAVTGVLEPAKTPTLWVLDKLSRPAYAAFEGMDSYYEARNEGENPLEAINNVGGGLARGIKGEDKTGFGEVIEELAKTQGSENPLQGEFNWLPESGGEFLGNLGYVGRNIDRLSPFSVGPLANDPETQKPKNAAGKWAKRGAGLAGEIALDPANVVGGKVITTIADQARSGQKADDAYRALISDTVDEAINSRGLNKPFNVQKPMRRPDPNNPGKFIAPNLPVGRTLLQDAAQRGIDNATIRIGGGSTRGRFIGADVGSFSIADNVSNEMRTFMLSNFDSVHKMFDDVLAGSKTLTKAEITQLRKDPIVAAYLDEFLRLTKKANPASTLNDVERILLKYSTRNKDDILSISNRAAAYAKTQLDDMVAGVRSEVFSKLDNQVKNVPALRVGRKEIPFKRLGKAYHSGKARLGTPLEGVQFQNQFPSITPQLANKVRSTGQDNYELFHADVQDIVRSLKLTKDERRAFNQRILENRPAPTQRLQDAQNFIQRAYRQMWQDEVDAGIRSADDVMPNNYVYNYYKPKGLNSVKYSQDIDNYRRAVKIDTKVSKSLTPNHIKNAQQRGLRVEQDAFRALLYRKLKSNRKLTQAWFKESLIDNFGILANRMSDKLANANRLKQIDSTLTQRLKDQLKEKGDHWYLPDDINEVYKKYIAMTSGNATSEMSQFIHMIDTVTRWFKQAATIYYPGFHIRNSMGDMFMSFIDGVRAQDYTDLKRIIGRVRNDPNATVKIGNVDIPWERIKALFDENVSTGGFKRTDFDTPDFSSTINPNRVAGGVRQASERREDFFRFTHFLHAFKEELPKAMKNTKDFETAIQTATRSSAYRVNKYLFDYGATTLFEKKYLKRVFPFYTYTRKAMPALAEGMFLHPSQFAKTNRFFLDDDDGSYADMLTPEYLREIGYRDLGIGGQDAENPWLLGGQFLPTDVLNRNTNVLDIGGFARNLMAQSNPLVKAGPELAAEEQFFNQRPIEGTGAYFSDSFLPFVHPAEDLIGAVKGTPGIPGSGDKSNYLSGRFGLGLPINQVTNSQQTAALYGILDEYKAELGKLNPKLEANGFRIYVSPRQDGASFRIRNENTNEVVFDTTDLPEAIRRAKELSK